MIKEAQTAESRPAYRVRLDCVTRTNNTTYKNQDGIQILVVPLGVAFIVLGCLPPVYSIEVKARIVGLGGLEGRSKSALEPTSVQWTVT